MLASKGNLYVLYLFGQAQHSWMATVPGPPEVSLSADVWVPQHRRWQRGKDLCEAALL